jgi:hypothetical protein
LDETGKLVLLKERVAVSPQVLVNGVEWIPESSLQSLRTAQTFHGLSLQDRNPNALHVC